MKKRRVSSDPRGKPPWLRKMTAWKEAEGERGGGGGGGVQAGAITPHRQAHHSGLLCMQADSNESLVMMHQGLVVRRRQSAMVLLRPVVDLEMPFRQ